MKREFPCEVGVITKKGKICRVVVGDKGSCSDAVWELDWSGLTSFARDVYEALMDLGVGERATYGEIARRIGRPRAHRAVGTACKNNPFPIIVPCHRVVASGGLGGFAFGLELKRALLEFEKGAQAGG